MKIETVAILGAGAIGSYFIYGFSAAPDIDFCLIAKGERKERLEKEGLCINDKIYKPKVKTPEEAKGVDLLLVSTKYNGLHDALEDIRTVVAPHTTVLSLLNGIDSEEMIGTVIDPARIAYSLMRINSERKGNSVTFNAEKTPGLFVGEKDSREESERLLAIRELLAKTPLRYHFCEDIISEQWLKFTLNIAYNLPQAVLGTGGLYPGPAGSGGPQGGGSLRHFLRPAGKYPSPLAGKGALLHIAGSGSQTSYGNRHVLQSTDGKSGRKRAGGSLCGIHISCD